MDASEAAALKSLLTRQPAAALATLRDGRPAVSMVPFAMVTDSVGFVIHVSRLASHTKDLSDNPDVALLVAAPPDAAKTVLALPRASIQGQARPCPADANVYAPARAAYLAKLPEAEELFTFADFSLFIIEPESVRYVAGFGRAMTLTAAQLQAAIITMG